MVISIDSKAAFDGQLQGAGDKVVIVDFYATWCGPCKVIAPRLETLSKEMPQVVFLKVDVEECSDLAEIYKITCMPTFLFFKGGKQIDTMSGANYDKIVELINKHS